MPTMAFCFNIKYIVGLGKCQVVQQKEQGQGETHTLSWEPVEA